MPRPDPNSVTFRPVTNHFPTSRQSEIIDVIRELTRETGQAPSCNAIAKRLGITPAGARKQLRRLEEKGLCADVPMTVSSGTWSVTAEGARWVQK